MASTHHDTAGATQDHGHHHQHDSALSIDVYPEEGISIHLLEAAIHGLHIPSVTWAEKFIVVDVAFGIQMLKVGCVIKEDAVQAEDIIEKVSGLHGPPHHTKLVKSASFAAKNVVVA